MAILSWGDPPVATGTSLIDMYQIDVLNPRGSEPLAVDSKTKMVKMDASTDPNESYLFSVIVTAVYNYRLESTRIDKSLFTCNSLIS